MVSRQELDKFLAKLISDEEKNLLNKNVLIKTTIAVISLVVAMIFVFIVVISQTINTIFIILAIMFAFTSLVLMLSRKTGAYKKLEDKYKTQVLDYILRDVHYEYEKNARIPMNVFVESGLAREFDDYSGEDLLILNIPDDDGSATKSNLVISDVKATKQEYNENTEEWETKTKYQGVLGYIRFPFEFKCRLTINRNDYAFLQNMDKVSLESIEFNKKFSIRTTDQIEARYILTPDMMQKLMAVQAKEKNFQMVLDGNTMFISIPGKNMFAITTRSKKIDGTIFYNLYEDIALFLDIIEEIKNNDKIFKF